RVPAPLAGPVGIFRFVVRKSGRGSRQCGRHRQCADQDSHNHGVFSLRECWERSILMALLVGCGRVCCALLASTAPATIVVPMNLRPVSMMVLPDGAALWRRFVIG